ncbi:hypothetical protein Tco_0285990 [Tanacetum coccineum]
MKTEVIIQEETPIKIIEEHGSGEKGEIEISTASPPKVTKVSTAEAHVYTRRSAKDKGKAIMEEPATLKKVKKRTQVQLSMDEEIKDGYKESYFKRMSYNDIRPIFERVWDHVNTFIPIGSEVEKGKPAPVMIEKKAVGTRRKTLARRRPIVNWEYQVLGRMEMKDMEVYKLTRADGTVSFHGGVHSVFLTVTPMEIDMLVEKKYPLKKEILEKMINLKLQAEEESTMAFELIKFTRSQIEEKQNLQAGGEYEDKDKDFEDIRRSPYNDKDT